MRYTLYETELAVKILLNFKTLSRVNRKVFKMDQMFKFQYKVTLSASEKFEVIWLKENFKIFISVSEVIFRHSVTKKDFSIRNQSFFNDN